MSDTAGKPIICKAAVAWEPKKPLSIETVEVAPPKAGEVRIKVLFTGVCHSDENIRNGNRPSYPLPMILGHEASGVVESVGEGVTALKPGVCHSDETIRQGNDLRTQWPLILGHEGSGIVESVGEGVTVVEPGDHVIPLFMPQCDDCKACKSPRTNLCDKIWPTQARGLMPDETTRFTCNGKPVYSFVGTSTFSEYTVLSQHSLCKVSKDAPMDKICLIGCCIATGYGAALNTAQVEKGSTCAVWGLGAVGMAIIMGCRAAGASKIYGVDINPAKAEMAKQFGMTDFINPKDYEKPVQQVLLEMTGGGLNYTFEAIGNVDTMRAALESLGKGGVSTIIGIPPHGKEISANPFSLITGKSWKGSMFGGWKSKEGVPKLVEKYMNKELMVDEFITHTMGLDKINDAFEMMLAGKSLRSVIHMQAAQSPL